MADLALAPAAITRRLRAAGIHVTGSTHPTRPGQCVLDREVVRVYPVCTFRDDEEERASRAVVEHLTVAGYLAERTGWGEVDVRLPVSDVAARALQAGSR
jgi:hypothetical protein